MEDLLLSYDAAVAAKDDPARARIRLLWIDYLETTLGSMTAIQFDAYLAARLPAWRQMGSWQVVKTAGTPCIAITAHINPLGVVSIHALGMAYRYPNDSADAWWTSVVLPRVRSFGP